MTASTGAEVRSLTDTNVVVYAYDPTDPVKHQVVQDLLKRLSDAECLVFSAQVFNEFCSVMRGSRRKSPLTPDQLAQTLRKLASTGDIVPMTESMTQLALGAMLRHGLAFWDALIWAAAKENGLSILYTEDFQDGRDLEGVRIVNPFATGV